MGNWSEDERGIFPFSFNEARPPLLAANQNVPPSSDVLRWVIQLFSLSSQIIQRFISFPARFYTVSPNKFRHSSFEFIGRGLSPFALFYAGSRGGGSPPLLLDSLRKTGVTPPRISCDARASLASRKERRNNRGRPIVMAAAGGRRRGSPRQTGHNYCRDTLFEKCR